MHAGPLKTALDELGQAVEKARQALSEAQAERDPLAAHIALSRRRYQNVHDTKSGKRRDVNARLSWERACELGFPGSLGAWEALMGAMPKR